MSTETSIFGRVLPFFFFHQYFRHGESIFLTIGLDQRLTKHVIESAAEGNYQPTSKLDNIFIFLSTYQQVSKNIIRVDRC